MKPFHICITSAGRRVELINSLRSDAQSLGIEIRLTALDSNPALSAACQKADQCFSVPRCAEPDYITRLSKICSEDAVDLLVPTIDTELPFLSKEQRFFAEKGCKIVISEGEAVKVARDKLLTAKVLTAQKIPSPSTALLSDVYAEKVSIPFPAVLKRIDGSSSIGLHFVTSLDEARALKLDGKAYVAQEKCVGPEYTVNCFVDQKGALRAAVPHRRIETRSGEVSKGVTERRDDLHKLAEQIVVALPGLRGPFCFQVILTESGPKVFEINARFGGGYPLAHAAGATFGKWLIEEAIGLPSTAHNNWQEGLLMLRYDAAIFKALRA
jgi:carbamoyl-phosphate synthase large subunit